MSEQTITREPPPIIPPPPPDLQSFSAALAALRQGWRISRAGWNGKGMWLVLVHPGNATHLGYDMQPCIAMKTADNKMQPGWLASQADMLSDDWLILDGEQVPPL